MHGTPSDDAQHRLGARPRPRWGTMNPPIRAAFFDHARKDHDDVGSK
ncbi:hypothetical protein L841_0509 [Mycobacterium sp. MAC_080597_8934]|nr:hypothetical protein L841_0509 [Mycobacterium sp. MAC_080597_8934]